MVDLYQWSVDFLKEHGLEQYEISNFAREDIFTAQQCLLGSQAVQGGLGWAHVLLMVNHVFKIRNI